MPISRMRVKDKMIWGYTKNGIYFFKSVYHLEHTKKRIMRGETLKQYAIETGWKQICGLKVPGSV